MSFQSRPRRLGREGAAADLRTHQGRAGDQKGERRQAWQSDQHSGSRRHGSSFARCQCRRACPQPLAGTSDREERGRYDACRNYLRPQRAADSDGSGRAVARLNGRQPCCACAEARSRALAESWRAFIDGNYSAETEVCGILSKVEPMHFMFLPTRSQILTEFASTNWRLARGCRRCSAFGNTSKPEV